MRLIYRVISSPVEYIWDSEDRLRSKQSDGFQLVPSSHLMQYLDNFKLSTRKREEYTGLENLRILQQRQTRDRSKKSSMARPRLNFAQISPLFWSFSRFWSSFIKIKVLNEEENSILHILYCYSLQQHIFLAFCNDFDTLSRVCIYSSQKNIVIPEMTSKANSPHSPLFLGCERGKGQIYQL